MSSDGNAAVHAFSSARAAASRANGAKSHAPRTAEGKARAAQNALRHGMCAKKFLLLPDDSRAEFAALEGALLADLRPEGALQTLLARRLIAAAWRLARADRLEFELLTGDPLERPGRVLTCDGRVERAFATLVRYRSGAQAELFRTLKALKALQAEPAAEADAAPAAKIDGTPLPPLPPAAARGRAPDECLPRPHFREIAAGEAPGEAESRTSVPAGDANAPQNEPESDGNGHRCATNATRDEPERPARTSGGFH